MWAPPQAKLGPEELMVTVEESGKVLASEKNALNLGEWDSGMLRVSDHQQVGLASSL